MRTHLKILFTAWCLVVFVAIISTFLQIKGNQKICWSFTSENSTSNSGLDAATSGMPNTSTIDNTSNSNQVAWSNTPSIGIVCRVFHGSAKEVLNILILSYNLFWPIKKWENSELVLIWDNESPKDHRMATIISNVPPYPKTKFEDPPPSGTLCSNWRGEGYARQQYSTFYDDLYTEAEYVGIVDSDSFFTTSVVPEDLFEDGLPRLIGYNGEGTGWCASAPMAVGASCVGEFMVVIGFPFMVKREHFKEMRDHITKTTQSASFEEAFFKICNQHTGHYSQFDIMGTYLWHFKRDEYSWHLRNGIASQHPVLSGSLLTNDPQALVKDIPKVGVMKHGGASFDIFPVIIDYICVGSDWTAGDCTNFYRDDINQAVKHNTLVDWNVRTTCWDQRGLPTLTADLREKPWVSQYGPDWNATYASHQKAVEQRGGSRNWISWKSNVIPENC